ncbi:MAG: hypothetical protein LBR23_09280 [Spirochaetaceae bacterium]|jgi:hypothetical protein|nr:hypothetical protein [Spirochaetaceae bacterium]
MKNHGTFFAPAGVIAAIALLSCATGPAPVSQAQGGEAPQGEPLWVSEPERVYPDSGWVIAVAQGSSRKEAETAALGALAAIFKVDVEAVTTANQAMASVVEQTAGKEAGSYLKANATGLDVTALSQVNGLIGVKTESWQGSGKAWANARMNRREAAARYAALIGESEDTIAALKAEAASMPGAFDAYQYLNLAAMLAGAADNYRSLLSVLDPSTTGRKAAYGSAGAVKNLANEAARRVVVAVSVRGDEGGRITTAYQEFFSTRGFRTNTAGKGTYFLSSSLSLEKVDLRGNSNVFVRYVLNTTLTNPAGEGVFSYSENGREGHLSEPEARQRAIRKAEASIGEETFAEKFDEYLASLIK